MAKNFPNMESLKLVENVIDEAEKAITITDWVFFNDIQQNLLEYIESPSILDILFPVRLLFDNRKMLKKKKKQLYNLVCEKNDAIIQVLQKESNITEERIKHLTSLSILLQEIMKKLQEDLKLPPLIKEK